MRKIVIIALAIMAVFTTACGDTQSLIDKKYSTETVNVTEIKDVEGVGFYAPDNFLENKTENKKDKNSYDLIGSNYILKVRKLNFSRTQMDLDALSKNLSKQFDEKITAVKITNEDPIALKVKCTTDYNGLKLASYAKVLNGEYIIFCACESDETASKTVDSIKPRSEKGKIDVVTIYDAGLGATVNNTQVGQTVTFEQMQSDFQAMAANFNNMKQQLIDVNGKTINDVNNKVKIQFNAVSEKGKEAQNLYITSVEAYKEAVKEYNIQLNNNISFESKKKEIEKAFGLDLSPEWEKIKINNENEKAAVKSVVIEYDNANDCVLSMMINGNDVTHNSNSTDNINDSSGTSNRDSISISESSMTSSDEIKHF